MLKEGDVIELKKGHKVYTLIPKHFAYDNCIGSFKLTKSDVTIGENRNGLNTEFMLGKWIVYKTVTDGGGTGHGPNDVYPDGHHVFCKRVVKNKYDYQMEIDFYQTGCFTAMIKDKEIEVVGKAKAKWTIVT